MFNSGIKYIYIVFQLSPPPIFQAFSILQNWNTVPIKH